MASLLLIRHEEPAVTGVMLGQLDPPLSMAGLAGANRNLNHIKVDVVWTSPLRRARQTADCIPGARVIELADLIEIDQGLWTGKTWREIEERWGEAARRKTEDWLAAPAPGGETWANFLDRVGRAWEVIRGEPRTAAVVAHQGVNAALLYLIEGREPRDFLQSYGEVIHIEYDRADGRGDPGGANAGHRRSCR